jgi:hypothetical protein
VTSFRKHWSRPAVAFGLAMLVMGHALRALAHAVVGLIDADRADRSWWKTLVAFPRWRRGWPAVG